ncbi:putative reverse transcriptase domain-containing protein [Tanacetum coccineum]|uniref:Reverse transcriptase domain-containing protein n=1 Tax=Tanacetum coccineum TaxID=301880 RepID=A0ABQ5A8L3_9ASTR
MEGCCRFGSIAFEKMELVSTVAMSREVPSVRMVIRMWLELTRLGTIRGEGILDLYTIATCANTPMYTWYSEVHNGRRKRNKVGNKIGNQTGGNEATAKDYAIGRGGTNLDSNIVMCTFLLNNCYASMLFDSGADRSFVLSTFSALLDIAPSTLDTSYVVELADGRISETNVVVRGFTLGLLGHPFDIDLMPKVVRIPYGDEVLIIRVTIMATKEKRLEDVPIIREFPKVFPNDLHGLPPARQVEFQIDLVPSAAPVATNQYRFAPSECKSYHQLQELYVKIISPVLHPGEHRIDDLFDQLQGSSATLRIDMRFGFSQIRVREEIHSKYAFRTRYGYYEFQVMPFGLTKVPAVFMDLMNRVCKPYLDRFVIVFIDDILIYSKSIKEHEGLRLILSVEGGEFVRQVFEREFWLSRYWASPKTPTEIRQYLGLAGYYRRFIKGFSKIARPMTKLTQKSMKFDWEEKAEAVFQLLKQKLYSASILALPKGSENFVVYCDASNKGLGAVLMQKESHGLQSFSSEKSEHEINDGGMIGMSTVTTKIDGQSERTFDLEIVSSLAEIIMRRQEIVQYKERIQEPRGLSKELCRLNPRYIGPFKILAKVGIDAILAIPLDEIQVDDKLHFIEEPVEIMDREVKRLKQSHIPIVKVR